MRITSRFVLLGGLLVLAVACEEDEFTGPELITTINVSLGDCGGLQVDETCQLEVLVQDQDGDVIENAALTWRTPDITIATVDFQGRVTGVREGQATIFAQSAPGPNDCENPVVVCDTQNVSVIEPDPGPGPIP